MLIGACGQRSLELLGRSVGDPGGELERAASTSVSGAPAAAAAGWRCWLAGRITNEDELRVSYPAPSGLLDSLAAAHAMEGPGCVEALRGAFVLVATDLDRDLTYVSRDHLGGRPLVFARLPDGALFAEHERQLVDLLPHGSTVDRAALGSWIDSGAIPPERTFFTTVSRVPPGGQLQISPRGVSLSRYWQPRFTGVAGGSRAEVAEQLRGDVFAAVERAAAGSTRVSVRLSGGLDSACVAAGLAARPGVPPGAVALSLVFPQHPESDEQELIEATSRQTGLPVERLSISAGDSLMPAALQHISRWRLPPATPNIAVWEPVMARARSLGVDAMLDGEGGDELFGIAPLLIADELRRGRFGRAWELTAGIPGMGGAPDLRLRLRALRLFGVGPLLPRALRRARRRRAALRRPDSLLAPSDLLALEEMEEPLDGLDGPRWWRALAGELVEGGEAMGVAAHFRREASVAGIDRRHPFLFDRDLVDAVLSLPPELLFDPVRDRSLLRDAVRGHVPEAVRSRYAKSYLTPVVAARLAGPDGEALRGALGRPDAPVRAFVRRQGLDRVLEPEATPRATDVSRLWRLGMANAWLLAEEGR